MIHFVGAGPGAVDLITLRGYRLLQTADVIIYAGSLVNPRLLSDAKEECRIWDSSRMTLEEVISCMEEAAREGKEVVRLHTGDPSLYGAVREQMDCLLQRGISFSCCPGVSSFSGAAAALGAEYTLPGVSQSLIITRLEGRTAVPVGEKLSEMAKHGASMAIFLSAGHLKRVEEELLRGAYGPDTPCAIVYKASWPEEKRIRTTLKELAKRGQEEGITKTALVLVGDFLGDDYERSRLYAPDFPTGCRQARTENAGRFPAGKDGGKGELSCGRP